MDDETLHELSAAYALDALEPAEREVFEDHLATCVRCREELTTLSAAAASLAYGVPPVDPPPPELRDRILEAVRAERPSNVVPLRPRRVVVLAACAAAAACAAIGLGAWDVSLHDQLSGARSEALVHVPVSGASGSVVVDSGGSGCELVLSNLAAAPPGKTYEAWVLAGKAVSPAGLFRGGAATTLVELSHAVPSGAEVAVTIEPAGGSAAPTGKPFIVSSPV